jgi:hypothetical protein
MVLKIAATSEKSKKKSVRMEAARPPTEQIQETRDREALPELRSIKETQAAMLSNLILMMMKKSPKNRIN